MDYLVFLTGLFLLAAGVGCSFLYRKDRIPSRWPLLAIALLLIGFKVWSGILVFSLGLGDWSKLVTAFIGASFATSLVGYCLSPLIYRHWAPFAFKWAMMVLCFAVIMISGISSMTSVGFFMPMLLVTFAGGWKISTFGNSALGTKRYVHPLVTASLLTVVVAISLLPNPIETAYDVEGQGHAISRIAMLTALTLGMLSSVAFCLVLWSFVYQLNSRELSANLLRRRKIGTTVIVTAALVTATNGAWLAHWLGNQAQQEQASTLLSAVHLGANNIDYRLVEKLKGVPEEIDSNNYNYLRSKLVEVRQALPGNRFTYLLGLRGDKLIFLVDAEDPANKETFSPPGSPVKDYPEKWGPELAGNATFNGPDRDDFGVWFAASVPIFDQEHNVVALLGVDYPAAEWLQPLAARRLAAMGVILSVNFLLIALFAFHLLSINNARKVESLSERLSDAMTAAEFDTWECFPSPFKLNIGDRLSTSLGLTTKSESPSFRTVWKHIHPEDRYQIFGLVRQKDSSEAEVRFKDANGRWLWFMLRGRIVHSHPDDPIRLVGTILNIDERQRTRLEIDKQRRFAQHVMESVPNGLAVIAPDGIISYANPAFIRLAGAGASSLVGKQIATLISKVEFTPRSNEGFETTLTRLDHALVPVQVFRAALSELANNAGSILAVVDLTGAKEAEQDLLRSRAEAHRLALVAKRTDNAVVITDAVGRIEWVNEGFTKISGYHKEEVVGQKPASFLQRPDVQASAQSYMRERMQEGKGFETEVINYGKSGRAYIVHIECQPLQDRNGNLTGFMSIERDITQTRRSSNLLEAVASISTTLLSRRIEPSVWGEILAALGSAANVDRCHLFQIHPHPRNSKRSVSQIATWSSGSSTPFIQNPDLQNQPFDESHFSRWHGEMIAGNEIYGLVNSFPKEEQAMLLAQNIRSLIVVPILTADKLWGFLGFDACTEDRIWDDWEIAILRSAAANIGLRQVAQNESDALVLARDQANIAAMAADKANLAKSTFLATMSHEIRTPLNAVIGMASLLETTPLNIQQKDYAETILNSSSFLLELINDILDYSRIESGKIDLDSSPFALADLCREAFDVVRLGAMGKQLELIARIAPHLPVQVDGDRSRIRQILINLLSNAVKFTNEGFVSLIVDGKQQADGRWFIAIEVKDSGIGIAPDAIGKLFRPFVQEDSSTTRRFGGSGLGLAISKRLAELMGGDITINSIQGKGSAFTATFVVKASRDNVAPSPPILAHSNATPLRILIVDDNELNRRILEETLASWGLSCHTAANGMAAIQIWNSSGPYDLVITDQHMPGMDGVELIRYLGTLPTAANTRFSLFSSESNFPAEIRALFHEVGSKPIWPSTLHGMLSRLFPGTITASAETANLSDEFESERLSSLKVLVAEDNVNNQKVIRLLLRRLGIEPHIVSNGQQAVEAAHSNPYDIVLLDIQMPVMDGLEASRKIIAQARSEKRPHIVALTANAFQEDRDAAMAAGMDDYLSKPITLARLREVLSKIASKISTPT